MLADLWRGHQQGLEESADLVFVGGGARENYNSFTIIEG